MAPRPLVIPIAPSSPVFAPPDAVDRIRGVSAGGLPRGMLGSWIMGIMIDPVATTGSSGKSD